MDDISQGQSAMPSFASTNRSEELRVVNFTYSYCTLLYISILGKVYQLEGKGQWMEFSDRLLMREISQVTRSIAIQILHSTDSSYFHPLFIYPFIFSSSESPFLPLPLIPISLRIFQSVVIHTVKGFSVVNEAEVGVFLEFSFFLHDLMNIGNLISGSSTFSKSAYTSVNSQFIYC